MDHNALAVQVRLQPGYAIITVAGEIDIATAPGSASPLAAQAGSGRSLRASLSSADEVSGAAQAGLNVSAPVSRRLR